MAIFVFIFFLLLISYGVLIAFYQRWWNRMPEFEAPRHDLIGHRMFEVKPPSEESLGDRMTQNDAVPPGSIGGTSIQVEGLPGGSIGDQRSEVELPPSQIREVKVAVVIALRNEAHNIKALLASLAKQQYPAHLLELILVDDHSDDSTWETLQSFSWPASNHSAPSSASMAALAEPAGDAVFPSMIIMQNGADDHSKKKALTNGIMAAGAELIITTDADCRFHPEWIATIVSYYTEKQAMFIAAPVAMDPSYSLLTIFQTLDFLALQGITGASVHRNIHTMCNGANLAYPKNAFLEVRGFEGIDQIPSGDDMLLMHKIHTRYPDQVFYLKSRHAIVHTPAETTWGAFFNQRIRWASKATHYKDKRIFYALLLTYLVNTCCLVMGIACFWNGDWLFLFILFLLAKTIIEYPFVNSVSMFFSQQRLMKFFTVLQPLHILYVIIAGWLGRFGSYRWKNRKHRPAK